MKKKESEIKMGREQKERKQYNQVRTDTMEIYRKRSEGKSVGATVKGNGEREMRESCSRRKRKSGRGRVKRGGER